MDVKVRKPKEVYEAIGNLEEHLKILDERLGNLGVAIVPVMSETAEATIANERRSYSCTLAQQIDSLCQNVEMSIMRIETFIERVEL